ncbi:unnamed protein product [Adineta ricciae]|uniref:HAT C-terminal dimerisation domain-containing protein n=1 Tax=Adineta ricciae TaxID=249248 RepID=A0A814XF82_ADIRI|nr:unnamed protein product [Adineta ricciae]CAF1675397.1 unnamed protein product [Adineta ricciae]
MLCRPSSVGEETTPKQNTKTSTLTLKQEFSFYVSSAALSKDFQTYWNENKNRFPILSSYARRYNCVPATSAAYQNQYFQLQVT